MTRKQRPPFLAKHDREGRASPLDNAAAMQPKTRPGVPRPGSVTKGEEEEANPADKQQPEMGRKRTAHKTEQHTKRGKASRTSEPSNTMAKPGW